MKISHSIKNIFGEDVVYIYITVNDIYEFGKENLGKGENTSFLKSLRTYISQNIKVTKKAAAVLVINGVIIGTLTLASLFPKTKIDEVKNENYLKENIQVYTEQDITQKENEKIAKLEDESKEDKARETNNSQEKDTKKEATNGTVKNTSSKSTTTTTKQTSKKNSTAATSKKQTTTTNTAKSSGSTKKATTTTKKTTTSSASNTSATNSSTNSTSNSETSTNSLASTSTQESTSSGITIKFNNGGVISNIDLEEYVIGVVAAEMPASFNIEALKAQAITARTYAMKKHSKGITLVNSTAHQVYYSKSQMQSLWGSSYNTYYNKIKNAVYSTKGQVLKYGAEYIEALFYAISNGKSELPKYVWNNSYPYLQAVSSSWDEGISAGNYTINMTYDKMSQKLGVKVDNNSEIKILSRTAGDRVDKVSISGKVFTGVEIRTKLGLRSADFSIKQNETNVTISTIGFGHGVGMSQYGANGAAKAGLSYRQILAHYYPGTSIVNI